MVQINQDEPRHEKDDFGIQVKIARELNAQALLLALYERCEDTPKFIHDFDRNVSYINVFDEKRRLGALLNNLGEMILLSTDICWERGHRSNGYEDLTLGKMRDLVIQSLEEGLGRAKNARAITANMEIINGEGYE